MSRSTDNAVPGRVALGVALTCALWASGACGLPSRADSRVQVRIATGSKLGVYAPLGSALATIYNSKIPTIAASAVETTGSVFNLRAVEEGRAELAFTQADVAYSAFHNRAPGVLQSASKLRSMAVLYVNAVQIIVLRTSGIHTLHDLAGRRVGVGPHESGTEVAAHVILQANGLEAQVRSESLAFDQIAERMKRGQLDAGFIVSSYPVPAIEELNRSNGIRLLTIEPALARRIRAQHPFLRPISIPRDAYTGQTADVETIGVDNLLVCRSDLSDDLIYRLTLVFFDSISALSRVHSAASAIDVERAPAAPIPVHSGAARLYRERELFR